MKATVQLPQGATITVALHCGTGFVSRAIRWVTRGRCNHASFVLEDGSLLEAREGRGVVRERTLADARAAGETVTLHRVPCAPGQAARILAFAHAQLGKPYDLRMALGFVWRPTRESRKARGKWFCSEFVAAALAEGGIAIQRVEPWKLAPEHLGWSAVLQPIPE